VAKLYTPSQKALVLEDAAKHGVTAAAEKHGISRFSIYDWQRKLTKAAAGEGPSPTSGPAPKDIEQQRDAEILEEWKTHPGLGPSQIRNQLRRKNVKVAVHTVRRVMEDAGYRPPKVVRQKHDRRFEAVRPNHLWHLDFVQRYIGAHLAEWFGLDCDSSYSHFAASISLMIRLISPLAAPSFRSSTLTPLLSASANATRFPMVAAICSMS
jgi:transposase